MNRRLSFGIAWSLAMATTVWAQDAQMQDMPGMAMPQPKPGGDSSHAGAQPDGMPTTPPAQQDPSQQHAGHDMPLAEAPALPPNDHVAPPPPQYLVHTMTPPQMTDMMAMDDTAATGMWMFDRLERTRSTSGAYASSWEAQGWWGNAINRVWLKTEGERTGSGTQDGRVEVLWSHAWTSFWDWQLGARHDFGQGPARQWAAVGVQGLAPYWFETQATFYLGEQGRTALRLESGYDLRFTQRLILQPRVEMNFYGKDDPQRGVTSGLSDLEAGLRLRYEFSRKFAPYVGVEWTRRFANPSSSGLPDLHARETTWVAGVRLWF